MSRYQTMLQWMMSIRVRLFSPVFISILFRPVMIIVFSHMESCFSFAVGMPEEGFKGEHA